MSRMQYKIQHGLILNERMLWMNDFKFLINDISYELPYLMIVDAFSGTNSNPTDFASIMA